MSEEKKISKKTLKIILGVCVGAVVALVVGFFAYIHVADTNTLGRKITIYGLDVSKLGVEDAKQKILTTFQDKKIVFKENGADVYIEKPVSVSYLYAQMVSLLENRNKLRCLFSEKPFTPIIP